MLPVVFRGVYRIKAHPSSTGCGVSVGLPAPGRGGTRKATMLLLQKVHILCCGRSSISISSVFGAIIIDAAL